MKSVKLWSIVLGFLSLHLVMAATLPLADDEAYYTFWATGLSLGYFDHPPMIAWWIGLGQTIFGHSLLGVRLVPSLAAALVTLAVYRMVWLMTNSRQNAVMGALFVSVSMPFAVLAFGATPDAPSILFWALGLWAIVEAQSKGNANWWLAVGVFAGLGVQSKFTNLFFGLGLLVWLFASAQGRKWLTCWQVWAGVAVGILVLLPQVWWNYQHDWVGLQTQFGRIGGRQYVGTTGVMSVAQYVVVLVFTVSPLIVWMAVRGVAARPAKSVFLWTSAPLLLFLAYHAISNPVMANWALPVYPMFAVLAALSLVERPAGWIVTAAAPVAVVIAGLAFGLAIWPGKPVFIGNNPFNQTKGWTPLAAELNALAKENQAVWIATDKYPLAAQLYFHLAQDYPVWAVTAPERYLFRADFPADLCNAKVLYFTFSASDGAVDRPPYFQRYKPLKNVTRRSKEAIIDTYSVGIAQGVVSAEALPCTATTDPAELTNP